MYFPPYYSFVIPNFTIRVRESTHLSTSVLVRYRMEIRPCGQVCVWGALNPSTLGHAAMYLSHVCALSLSHSKYSWNYDKMTNLYLCVVGTCIVISLLVVVAAFVCVVERVVTSKRLGLIL